MVLIPTSTQPSRGRRRAPADPISTPRQTSLPGPQFSSSSDLEETKPVVDSHPALIKEHSHVQSKNKITDSLASLYDEPNAEICGFVCEKKTTNDNSRTKHEYPTAIESTPADKLPGTANNIPVEAAQILDKAGYASNLALTPHNFVIEEIYLRLVERCATVSYEWIGSGPFKIKEGLKLQRKGELKGIIAYRNALIRDLTDSPYHPELYINLSGVDNKLGFCDIGAANAHRALVLVRAGLNIDKSTSPKSLGPDVRRCMASRTAGNDLSVISELRLLHVRAFHELLLNLLDAGAFWEGLEVAKEALKIFPKDKGLIETEFSLKEAFIGKCRAVEAIDGETVQIEDIEAIANHNRQGSVYQKLYPWLDKTLYSRPEAVVKEVNRTFGAVNCEVRRVDFGKELGRAKKKTKSQDTGPLGVFATKNIRQGELIMVDKGFMTMSDVPSSHLVHCDACHASLLAPYVHPSSIIKPSCCGKVAYCSKECYEVASKGYHSIVCGKDVDWLYQDAKGKYSKRAAGGNLLGLLFLRLMSIVLFDRCSQEAAGQKPPHPLQHPLIVRMTANYPPPSALHQKHCSPWMYSESVVATHRILKELGVNVFTTPEFEPAVIQTICWRLLNNSNSSIVNLSPDGGPNNSSSTTLKHSRNDKEEVHMMSLGSNYLFFNHSCEPNVDWHGSNPNPWVGVSYLTGFNGEILKPGCGAIWCRAIRDVKKDEQLKISYVGDAAGEDGTDRKKKRYMLDKWFDGGCGCRICEREDQEDSGDDGQNEEDNGDK